MVAPEWNPDQRTLRQFSAFWLVFFIGLGAYGAWQGGAVGGTATGPQAPWLSPFALWGVALAIGVPGMVVPSLARPIYVGMMVVAFPIGWVVSHVLLAVVYFGLFTAIGVVFRLMGRDRLALRRHEGIQTYWRDRPPTRPAAQYFKLW